MEPKAEKTMNLGTANTTISDDALAIERLSQRSTGGLASQEWLALERGQPGCPDPSRQLACTPTPLIELAVT